jgi:hypothetical protein
MQSQRAETTVKKNNCKSKGLVLVQPFHDQLRSDLAALEREHLIESFLDAAHTLRFRLVEREADHLLDDFATTAVSMSPLARGLMFVHHTSRVQLSQTPECVLSIIPESSALL